MVILLQGVDILYPLIHNSLHTPSTTSHTPDITAKITTSPLSYQQPKSTQPPPLTQSSQLRTHY